MIFGCCSCFEPTISAEPNKADSIQVHTRGNPGKSNSDAHKIEKDWDSTTADRNNNNVKTNFDGAAISNDAPLIAPNSFPSIQNELIAGMY